jgi:hypothetical protein
MQDALAIANGNRNLESASEERSPTIREVVEVV